MSQNGALPNSIPETTKTFQIDIQGGVTKKRYLGDFTCRVRTLRDHSNIARHEAMLNGEFASKLPDHIRNLHAMLAHLRYTLTDYPTFWRESDQGQDLMDGTVVKAIYDQVIAFEDEWMSKIWDEPEVKK